MELHKKKRKKLSREELLIIKKKINKYDDYLQTLDDRRTIINFGFLETRLNLYANYEKKYKKLFFKSRLFRKKSFIIILLNFINNLIQKENAASKFLYNYTMDI